MEKHIKKVCLGVDWGTHSSKWAADIVAETGENIFLAAIMSSDLLLNDGEILMSPSDGYLPEIERVMSFKRYIINDPYTPFWAYRDDINMSMGAGVAFSICSILGDFISTLATRGLSIDRSTDIEVGFSFPNWLKETDAKSRIAATNYHKAIVISSCLFTTLMHKLPSSRNPYSVNNWEELIDGAKKDIVFPTDSIIGIADMTKIKYHPHDFNVGDNTIFAWRYLVESCAAGLPYLRNIQLETPPGNPGLGKLLVIDIGAGSTDIGYMLRTISRQDRTENLFYFPPAATLPVAGNALTDEIKAFHDSTGKSITFSEAENYKITATPEWINKPFAERWKKEICEHVEEYVASSPDKRWLDIAVPLQLIITGGSAIIDGLSTELKKAVSDGLARRGLNRAVSENVKTINENLFAGMFPIQQDYARMAVAIGSADRDKPALKYLPRMDPPPRLEFGFVRY